MTVKEFEFHPGHWKLLTSGANGILNEVTEARKVTKRVYEILRSWKVPTAYFEDNTSTNQNQNINTLVNEHNKDKDGLIVSIHFNASGGTQSRGIGTEVLYYDQKDMAAKIAKAISDATGGGLLNRGAKQRKDLGVLASTYEPAILIEVCFVNSTVDAAIYRRDFGKICQAIAKELAAYLGKTVPSTSSPMEGDKEEVKVTNWNPGSPAMFTEAEAFLARAVKEGIIQESHLKYLKNCTMTTDRLLGLYITIQQRRASK